MEAHAARPRLPADSMSSIICCTQTDRVGFGTCEPEHVAVHDDRVAASERLREMRFLSGFQGDLVALGNLDGLAVAVECDGACACRHDPW